MQLVPLSQGKFAKVDDWHYERIVSLGPWHAFRARNSWYACHIVRGTREHVYMHHVVMGRKGIDHVNLDGLDNQETNLRDATVYQQSCNARLRCDNSTGVKGVVRDSTNNVFKVRITVNGKRIYLGNFTSLEKAKAVIDEARKNSHGEFARHSDSSEQRPRSLNGNCFKQFDASPFDQF